MIIIKHYKDPYQPTSISWNVNRALNVNIVDVTFGKGEVFVPLEIPLTVFV